MLSLFKNKKSIPTVRYAEINGERVEVQPKETLLHAALRENINFPHSCRVGGCASCKCRLVSGKVKELTDIGYILSEEELDQGYILACQSIPQCDVTIEVDLSAQAQRKKVAGKVVLQEHLTHDITHLKIQLGEALNYKAGQYADLSIDSLPGVVRSYSFAAPVQPDSSVSFFIRKVPAGLFSVEINEKDLTGQLIQLDGPAGDFWLRQSDAPMILIAGGSGLAPILAILWNALNEGCQRSVTLLFGAQTQADLYALDQISEIKEKWPARFEFIPVLSSEDEHSSWGGARGLVTETIPTLKLQGAEAYLCGPPAMIDAAERLLIVGGIERKNIHADRFITLADANKGVAAEQVN
ncbi:2Fe-2S iron-sulfur cluster binding domain-containing protein [uncultured Alcanivorax sp.]|uniref:2Fe-2S iron-sulfur cluster binding domain-containing protein n=1 Tax=uncultured Alcanivorax sp. TaxID=191215 RepID=UPI00258E45E0|nr:2Fe-2S iron-sulfur cluster binding domain-containing protein [uncultured Alcanivorax sp.]